MAEPVHLWLREVTKPMEHRTALTPTVCDELLKNGFKITVERCSSRAFKDHEYESVGCEMADGGTWKAAPRNAYIVGLKELPEESTPLEHTHIFFAHCYKNQAGWQDILGRFKRGQGTLLDIEFLNDKNGRRVAAFGYHAGFVGAALGLDAWCHQQLRPDEPYPAVKPYDSEKELVDHVKNQLAVASRKLANDPENYPPKIMVMGALGRCGGGAVEFSRLAGIPEDRIIKWDKDETAGRESFDEIIEHDIFINCIYLDRPIPPFVSQSMADRANRKLTMVVDVSCDTTNPHNPIPIYNVNSTFDKPLLDVKTQSSRPLQVISIDHLPAALPRASSELFSQSLKTALLQLKKREESPTWTNAEALYREKLALLPK